MAEQSISVNVEKLTWERVFPFVHIFKAFSMAMHPAKMAVALLMVVILFAGGYAMDLVGGQTVVPGEIIVYTVNSSESFDEWLDHEREFGSSAVTAGVFESLLFAKIETVNQLFNATVTMNHGLMDRVQVDQPKVSVKTALYKLFVAIPGWMWHAHKVYFIVYGIFALFVWALFGGAISRMAALHAGSDYRASIGEAIGYAKKRYLWFVIVPLILPALAAIVGLVFNTLLFGIPFNWPVVDTLAGLFFGVGLIFGALATVMLIANTLAFGLYYPSISVEDADAFDAIGHGVNYVIGRFFTWLWYNIVALMFGVITYLIIAGVVVAVIKVTSGFISMGIYSEKQTASDVLQSFAVQPSYKMNYLTGGDLAGMNTATSSAAWIVRAWTLLFVGLLAAYAYSYYICANTWIYLLLRRSADGTEMDDVFVEDEVEVENKSAE